MPLIRNANIPLYAESTRLKENHRESANILYALRKRHAHNHINFPYPLQYIVYTVCVQKNILIDIFRLKRQQEE